MYKAPKALPNVRYAVTETGDGVRLPTESFREAAFLSHPMMRWL